MYNIRSITQADLDLLTRIYHLPLVPFKMSQKIKRTNVQDIIELNTTQKGILFHYLEQEYSNTYNVQLSLEVIGNLNILLFENACRKVQRSNEALRSVFRWEEVKNPIQIILHDCPLHFFFNDVSDLNYEHAEEAIADLTYRDRSGRFDITELPFMIRVIRTAGDRHLLVITHHHILYDGWSNGILIREIMEAYWNQLTPNQEGEHVKTSYKILYKQIAAKRLPEQENAFWHNYLRNARYTNYFNLPTFENKHGGEIYKLKALLDLGGIKRISETFHVTGASIFYAAFSTLLYAYFQQTDIVFGTTVSGRDLTIDGFEDSIGNFINTIPFRQIITPELTLHQVITYAHESLLETSQFSHVSYYEIKKLLDLKGKQLFDSLLIVQNYPLQNNSRNGIQVKLESVYEKSDLPLVINIFIKERIEIEFICNPVSIEQELAEELLRNYAAILEQICQDGQQTVRELRIRDAKNALLAIPDPNYSPSIIQPFDRDIVKTTTDGTLLKEEVLLLELWKQILQVDRLGVDENLFYHGADSILLIQVSSRLRGRGYKIPVNVMMAFPTIRGMAKKLEPLKQSSDQMASRGELLLTPIQAHYFKMQTEDLGHYNQSVLLHFKERLPKTTATEVLNKLQEHHDTLRIIFDSNDSGYFPIYKDTSLPVSIQEYYLQDSTPFIDLADKLQASISLSNGPLIRYGLFHFAAGYSWLLIIIHHLITDGISWRILLEDLDKLVHQKRAGSFLTLPNKTDSFKLWSQKLRLYIQSESYLKGKAYWDRFAKREHQVIGAEFPNGRNIVEIQQEMSFELDSILTADLLTRAHRSFGTKINDLLLTALALSIQGKYGIRSTYTYLESHGRETNAVDAEVSRTIGWFTNQYPVSLTLPEGNLAVIVKSIKEQLLEVPQKGFDYLVGSQFDSSFCLPTEVPSIKFNYLGQFDSDILQKEFELVQANKGQEVSSKHRREVALDIWGIVLSGALKMTVTYSAEQYSAEFITHFMKLYKANIEEIVRFCCEHDKQELTPSDLTYSQLKQETLTILENQFSVEDVYPLSSMQEGMLFHSLLHPSTTAYFEQKTVTLEGKVCVDSLRQSFELLIQKHDVFRTVFLHERQERPLQVVLRQKELDFIYADVRSEIALQGEQEFLDQYRAADRERPFALHKGNTLRIHLLQTAIDRYTLIWSYHHILMDGWCMGLLWQEARKIYGDLLKHIQPAQENPTKYSTYISWQESLDLTDAKTFWKSYLSGVNQATELPKTQKEGILGLSCHQSYSVALDQQETAQLRKFIRDRGITENIIVQAAWGILLHKYTQQDDIVFGTVVSGRPAEVEGVEKIVGLFINTVPVRFQKRAADTFIDVLSRLSQEQQLAAEHHTFPLMQIQSGCGLGRGIFDHILVFENYPLSNSLMHSNLGEAKVTGIEVFEQTSYDLTIIINPGEQLAFQANFNAETYEAQVVQDILHHMVRILKAIIKTPSMLLNAFSLVTPDEEAALVSLLDNQQHTWPQEVNVFELFEQQALQRPKEVAIVYHDTEVTYEELYRQSAQVSTLLQRHGVKAGQPIGVYMDRSHEYIIALMGILRMGAIYLPLDVDYPDSRIQYMLEDSGSQFIMCKRERPPSSTARVTLCFWEDSLQESPAEMEQRTTMASTSVCYIIYTSGTTGSPKGVMITHQNVVRLFYNSGFQFDFNERDVWTMFHSPCFDFSIWEIFGAVLFGGKLIIIPKMTTRDPKRFLQLLREKKVTILNQTPSAFYNLIAKELDSSKNDLLLRYVIFGGEALRPGKLAEWVAKYPEVTLINMFGITETTVHVTYKKIGAFEVKHNISNIGKPIPTLAVYILDENMKVQPPGVIGELYIGGEGVAKGYWGKEELTRTRFVENPYDIGKKLYKSGDMARLLHSGDIEYIGRLDQQVQLRGFRIELGEIETVLKQYEGITDAFVLVKEKGHDARLIAYYIGRDAVKSIDLRSFLSRKLAEHMVPAQYIRIEEVPLTSNGKIDLSALPDSSGVEALPAVGANNKMEKDLIAIWAEVLDLQVAQVGININFFELGGDSMRLVRMVDLIETRLGCKMSVADAFTYPVISLLALFLKQGMQQEETQEDPADTIHATLDLFDQL